MVLDGISLVNFLCFGFFIFLFLCDFKVDFVNIFKGIGIYKM